MTIDAKRKIFLLCLNKLTTKMNKNINFYDKIKKIIYITITFYQKRKD